MAFSMKNATVARPAAKASVDRRAVLGLIAASGAALLVPQEAQAIKIPSQESYGGLGRGGGSMPKSSSKASMEGYSLEGFTGTKKGSYLPPGERKEKRKNAREEAMKQK